MRLELTATLLCAACGLRLPRTSVHHSSRAGLRMVASWYDSGSRLTAPEAAPAEGVVEAAPVRSLSIAELKAEGQAALVQRAATQEAYLQRIAPPPAMLTVPTMPAAAVAPARSLSIAELKAEGQTAVARRVAIQELYLERVAPADDAGAAPTPPAPPEPAAVAALDDSLDDLDDLVADDEAVTSFLQRAEQRSAARAAARADPGSTSSAAPPMPTVVPAPPAAAAPPPAPRPPAPAGALTLDTARSVNELLGIDTRNVALPTTAVDLFENNDLLVPNKLNDDEQDGWLGAIAAGTGLLFLLNVFELGAIYDLGLSALIGGGLSGYAALRKDAFGDVSRSAGKVANKGALATFAKAKELNEEYEVSDKAKKKAIETVKQVTEKLKENLKQ